MEKEFVPYEIALELKELGFDKILCYGFYFGTEDLVNVVTNIQHKTKNKCLAPTFSQAFRWFREKHNLEGFITPLFRNKLNISFENRKYDANILNGIQRFHKKGYDTYEEAELACLRKLIKIVKNGNSR